MKTFYFTFGTDNSYPFFGGLVKVHAQSKNEAVEIFNQHHKPRGEFVNCAFIYDEEEYRRALRDLQFNNLATDFFSYCHAEYQKEEEMPKAKKEMKSSQFINLFEGYNQEENFRVLICAFDRKEAQEIADEYALDSHMTGKFYIQEADSIDNTHYDCDYVLTLGQ